MTRRHLLGVAKDARGRIAPVFAEPDLELDAFGHHKAVVAALRKGPFVPAAFGSLIADNPHELVNRLQASRARLSKALERSSDAVELGLVISFQAAVGEQARFAATGRAFLKTVAARAASLQAGSTEAHGIVARAAAEPGVFDYRILSETSTSLHAAIAVTRSAAATLADQLQAVASPGLTIDMSGPWPLYSFGLRDILAERAA